MIDNYCNLKKIVFVESYLSLFYLLFAENTEIVKVNQLIFVIRVGFSYLGKYFDLNFPFVKKKKKMLS